MEAKKLKALQIVNTLHFHKKNLSIQSTWDSKSGLDTIDPNWLYLAKYFFPNTSSLSAIYDSSKSKFLKEVK